jgi:hypothetical protein
MSREKIANRKTTEAIDSMWFLLSVRTDIEPRPNRSERHM